MKTTNNTTQFGRQRHRACVLRKPRRPEQTGQQRPHTGSSITRRSTTLKIKHLHSPDANFQTGLPVRPPEKRAKELAFGVQQDTFSESDLGARHAELRGFVAILRGKTAEFLCG